MTTNGIDRSGSAGGSGASATPIDTVIVDAKGDIIAGTADNAVDNLTVGANETRLVADSTQATGLKYVADTTNYAINAKGDLLAGTAADTLAAHAVSTNGMALVGDSSQTDGLLWAALALIPGGRLTLMTALPVTTADVSGATTVYYTPFKHNVIMLYDGAGWIPKTFSELSQLTTDNTKSPAAVANSSNYDVFVWSDSGTLRATRGPAWTSDTGRGTGAATTELELFEGRYVNKIAITNGPAARRGLYVGSIRSDASAQINDTARLRLVWNNYNRVVRPLLRVESTDTWTYNTASFQYSNASATNRLDVLRGLDEDVVDVTAISIASNDTAGVTVATAIGLDSSTAKHASCITSFADSVSSAGFKTCSIARWSACPGLGFHFLSWMERAGATGNTTWIGDNGGAILQTGITGNTLA